MDIEQLFYRIISGYYTISIDNTFYKVVMPDVALKQKAHSVYLSILDQYKYDVESWISESATSNLLRIYSIWDDQKEQDYKLLSNTIEALKIELYLKFSDINSRISTKKKIKELESTLSNSYAKKHYFDHLTLNFYATSLKNQYIIMNCIFDSDDKRVFSDNMDEIDTIFLEKILYEIHNETTDYNILKDLARSDMWKQYWDCLKENVFNKPSYQLTDDQRALINISKMYDSIREHHECPSEDVINDNYALDGWILYQRDKVAKEKKKDELDNRVGIKNKRADEVFIMTGSKEETKNIYSLNDDISRFNIKQMKSIAKEKGSVQWKDLPHVKQQIQNLAREGKQ